MDLTLINNLVQKFGADVVTEMKTELTNNGSIASSRLLNSLTFKAKTDIEKILIQWSSEDYVKFVEEGRKAGTYPPISKIKQWCSVKGIPQQAAFPIQKSIYKFGIKPKPFLLNSYRKNRDNFIVALIKLYQKEIISDVKKAFAEKV